MLQNVKTAVISMDKYFSLKIRYEFCVYLLITRITMALNRYLELGTNRTLDQNYSNVSQKNVNIKVGRLTFLGITTKRLLCRSNL